MQRIYNERYQYIKVNYKSGNRSVCIDQSINSGIYPVMWAWKNADAFNSELKEKYLKVRCLFILQLSWGYLYIWMC